jgi:hypothetical protein
MEAGHVQSGEPIMKVRRYAWVLLAAVLIGIAGAISVARAGQVSASTPSGSPYPIVSRQTRSAAALETANSREPAKRYFVEFRARNAASYGHLYVLYGEVNARQEIVSSHIAGFFPAGDSRDCENCSVYYWTIGHLIFVPSELGASDGDLEERYVLTRFRIWLSPEQYRKLAAYIDQKKANKFLWNALWNNCVGFGRDVAEFMNLKVPLFVWLTPEDFVTALRKANGVANPQGPLKDAPGSVGASSNSTARIPPPQKPKVHPAATVQPASVQSRS